MHFDFTGNFALSGLYFVSTAGVVNSDAIMMAKAYSFPQYTI